MEGDAGARRLNPTDAAADQTNPELTTEDSAESEVGAGQIGLEVTTEDGDEPGQAAQAPVDDASPESPIVERSASRLGRGWLIGIAAALLVLAGGVGAGGYFALHSEQESKAAERNDAAAMQAAKDCVAATQAPDIAAMADSAQKIMACATGDFGAQAALYSGLLVEAYQAANAHVQVSDMRAAVERNNDDGSVNVLVALRIKVSNAEANGQEAGYRLRVTMAPEEGQYKISKLDQVTK